MDIRKLKSPYEIIRIDPWLEPYSGEIDLRMNRFLERRAQLVGDAETLTDFANGHLYFGIHRTETGWVVREWLPGADAAYLTGDFNGWSHDLHPMEKKENGVWEILLEGRDALKHGQNIKLWVEKNGGGFERIPACITRTQQDPRTHMLCGQVWDPEPFAWTDVKWQEKKPEAPLIYEAHIGMATQEERIGTYREFADLVLPRIQKLGYNTVQLMAIQEHPYYGSFGYQVTNFFAPQRRGGTAVSGRDGRPVLPRRLRRPASGLGNPAVQLRKAGGASLPAEQPEILDRGIPLRRVPFRRRDQHDVP